MNLDLRCYNFNSVKYSGTKPHGNLQSGECYQVWFGTLGAAMYKSGNFQIVQDGGSVFRTEGRENGGVGRKKGYICLSFCDFLVQLVTYDSFHSYSAFCWLRNIKRPSLHHTKPPGTSEKRNIQSRFRTCRAAMCQQWGLLLNYTPFVPLRPCASLNKWSCSQVVQTVQPSNTASNTHSVGNSTQYWRRWIENTSLFTFRCL